MRRVCLRGPLARTHLLHLEGVQTKNSTVLKKLMGPSVTIDTGEKNKYSPGSCTLLLYSIQCRESARFEPHSRGQPRQPMLSPFHSSA